MSFVGLRAKMYSFVTESDHKEHMKAKGVSKEALSHLHHEDYVKCLKEGTSNSVRMEGVGMPGAMNNNCTLWNCSREG